MLPQNGVENFLKHNSTKSVLASLSSNNSNNWDSELFYVLLRLGYQFTSKVALIFVAGIAAKVMVKQWNKSKPCSSGVTCFEQALFKLAAFPNVYVFFDSLVSALTYLLS